MKKNQKGITLIALVITIIVLLILAGVSIAMLTGDNGILNQATRAKNDSAEAEVADKINMALNSEYTNLMADEKFTTPNDKDKEGIEGAEPEKTKKAQEKAIIRANGLDDTYTATIGTSLTPDTKDEAVLTITSKINGKDITGKITYDKSKTSGTKYSIEKANYPKETKTAE